MGDIAKMTRLERVLDTHEEGIVKTVKDSLPEAIRDLDPKIFLENDIYKISVFLYFINGETLQLRPFEFEYLQNEYPECFVSC